MKLILNYTALIILLIAFVFCGCMHQNAGNENPSALPYEVMENIPDTLPVSIRMAESLMKQFPYLWNVENIEHSDWRYTLGLSAQSFLKLYQATGNEKYLAYAKDYADSVIDKDGKIRNYNLDEFNIDKVNSGKILFILYDLTKDVRYLNAASLLRKQIEWQPRTRSGGFWHKLIYPYQMWLDGIYMGEPFYAEYESRFGNPGKFDDIARQFILIEKKTRDPKTGLLYHAWDESRLQRWSDPETGCSKYFWGRAVGWYAMALVDVLDYFPADHPKRKELIAIINRLAVAIVNVQDEKTGVWYQILNLPDRDGNYREGSASAMFVYFLVKAVNQGYLNESYLQPAMKGYHGILKNLMKCEKDGQMSISPVCRGAGLGGRPYRDGSFEYYVNEGKFDNDTKATGPFIMAALMIEKMGLK